MRTWNSCFQLTSRAARTTTEMSYPLERAVALVAEPEYVDDFDWTYVSAAGLSVMDAWAMATTWSELLQDDVGLLYDHSQERAGIIPNYDWVAMMFGDRPVVDLRRATAAHATSLVWRALSACPGYGADEHPTFWKRLLGSLEETGEHSMASTISDGNGFFEGVTFPRFRVKINMWYDAETIDRVVRIFCGLEAADEWSEITREMEKVLLRLAPMATPSRLAGPVEVKLRMSMSKMPVEHLNDLIAAIQTSRGTSTSISDALDLLMRPSYNMVVEKVGELWGIESLQYGEGIKSGVAECFVESKWARRDVAKFQDFVECTFGINSNLSPPRVGCVGYFHFQQTYTGNELEGIPALCSALPQTRSIHTFHIQWFGYSNTLHLSRHAAWLGYALFHPDTATSTWHKLEMTNAFATNAPRRGALTMMAQGNNLALELGLSNQSVDAYYTATIRAGAPILGRKEKKIGPTYSYTPSYFDGQNIVYGYSSSDSNNDSEDDSEDESGRDVEREDENEDSDQSGGGDENGVEICRDSNENENDSKDTGDYERRCDAADDEDDVCKIDYETTLFVLRNASQFDVCVTSTNLNELDEWVVVIVAGYGNAWVHSRFIEKIVARPPARGCLTALKLRHDYPQDELQDLLELTCDSLESLDFEVGGNHAIPIDLNLAESCPSLKSLKLTSWPSQSLWGTLTLPIRLRELSLNFRNTPDIALQFADSPLYHLHDLQTLHIRSETPPSERIINEFVLPLLRALRKLQRFQWKDNCGSSFMRLVDGYDGGKLSYPQSRYISRAMLLPGFVPERDDFAIVHEYMPLKSILALLSVVKYYHDHDENDISMLAGFNHDLVKLIAGFAGSKAQREIWII